MPNVGLIGNNGPFVTGIVSNEFTFNEGPYPGFVNAHFIMQFTGIPFQSPPNVLATTGNPHWTAHPIWVRTDAAGFVVNRKTESPGGRQFQVYVLAMGQLAVSGVGEARKLEAQIVSVSEEQFNQMAAQGGAA